jgi:hypothetical protein
MGIPPTLDPRPVARRWLPSRMQSESVQNVLHLTSQAPIFNVVAFWARTGWRSTRARRETFAMAPTPSSDPRRGQTCSATNAQGEHAYE